MSDQTTLELTTEAPAQPDPQDRRAMLDAAFTDAAEKPQQSEAERARDEAGRFAKKNEPEPAPQPEEPVTQRPAKLTTWKRDYIPLHEKLEQGLPLSAEEAKRLAEYNIQRESEYSTGISMHKDRASRLESVQKAIEPFMPLLQQHNIQPDQWIANLGRAHHTLATGNEQQRLQAFMRLAQEYNVPLTGMAQQGQGDPAYMALMEHINQLNGQIQSVASWKEQQDQQRVSQAIAEFEDAEKYPHFEKVRGAMAQLLESGLAPDLKTAYAKAIRMDDEVWQDEQARLSQATQTAAAQTQAVAQAKAKAVSPRSTTPSGQVSNRPPATDRRALLEAAFGEASGRV